MSIPGMESCPIWPICPMPGCAYMACSCAWLGPGLGLGLGKVRDRLGLGLG